jgi:hypothetical protein
MSESDPIASYQEFWPFYLREHAKSETRLWHYVGTAAGSVLLVAALVSFSLELLIAAVIAGYGPAWFAHVFVEKNRPATLRYPLWSLRADYRMAGAWLTGRLGRELEKAGLPSTESPSR